MQIICKPRRSGKTTEIIKIADKNNSSIVCLNLAECRRVARQAEDMGLSIPFPITIDEFISGSFFSRGINSLIIDNAEFVIRHLAKKVPVKAISVSIEG